MSNTYSKLSIVGKSASKIKNNLKRKSEHFSWKITFPQDIQVEDIPKKNIMILNDNLKIVESEYEINALENYVRITPKRKYTIDTDYFFIAKYKLKGIKKDMCIAFSLLSDNTIKTYTNKESKMKLQRLTETIAKRNEAASNSGSDKTSDNNKQRDEVHQ